LGLERHGKDPDEGSRCSPKLTLVGRITGTVNGRPWSVSGDGEVVAVEMPDLATAFKFRRAMLLLPPGPSKLLSGIVVPLRLHIGRWPGISIGPRSLLRSVILAPRRGARGEE
jgi:hypothetical protein